MPTGKTIKKPATHTPSKWKVKLADGKELGVKMTRLDATARGTADQLQKIIDKKFADVGAKTRRVVDWEWCEEEDWGPLQIKILEL
jgi:hypothetical protein